MAEEVSVVVIMVLVVVRIWFSFILFYFIIRYPFNFILSSRRNRPIPAAGQIPVDFLPEAEKKRWWERAKEAEIGEESRQINQLNWKRLKQAVNNNVIAAGYRWTEAEKNKGQNKREGRGAKGGKRCPPPPDIACMADVEGDTWGEVKEAGKGPEPFEPEEGKRREVTLEDIGRALDCIENMFVTH